MGVEPYQFVSALNCVMAQRLVRLICAHCKRQSAVDLQALEEAGLSRELAQTHTFYEGAGCIECGGTGFKGRTAICELLNLSDRIREMILDRRPASEVKKAAHEEGCASFENPRSKRCSRADAPRDQQGDVRRMSILASWLASPPLDAAIEIAPEAVSIAVLGGRGQNAVVQGYAVEPMPIGAVVPSLTATNMPIATSSSARSAQRARASVCARDVALVVPDLVGKVSLVKFDHTPTRRDDLDQLIRWQVKKSTPFPIEDACVTHSAGAQGEFVVVAARREIIREYEGVCEEAGIEAGLVDLADRRRQSVPQLGTCRDRRLARRSHAPGIYVDRDPAPRGHDLLQEPGRGDEESCRTSCTRRRCTTRTAWAAKDSPESARRPRKAHGAVDMARRDLEEHMGTVVEPIDPTRGASLTDRIQPTPELMATLSPLVGMLLRGAKAVNI